MKSFCRIAAQVANPHLMIRFIFVAPLHCGPSATKMPNVLFQGSVGKFTFKKINNHSTVAQRCVIKIRAFY
jgi:hypothetical protein